MDTWPSRGAALALLLATGGCARGTHPRTTTPATALGTTSGIEQLIRLALANDAAFDRSADTLYATTALVVANARVRLAAPRFAGIGYGGRVTVATATVTVSGRLAWGMVDYRWFNLQQNQAEAGRATFVFENREGSSGWKIIHVHSSQLLPWER